MQVLNTCYTSKYRLNVTSSVDGCTSYKLSENNIKLWPVTHWHTFPWHLQDICLFRW